MAVPTHWRRLAQLAHGFTPPSTLLLIKPIACTAQPRTACHVRAAIFILQLSEKGISPGLKGSRQGKHTNSISAVSCVCFFGLMKSHGKQIWIYGGCPPLSTSRCCCQSGGAHTAGDHVMSREVLGFNKGQHVDIFLLLVSLVTPFPPYTIGHLW